METHTEQNQTPKARRLRAGFNMYTSTISLGLPFQPDTDAGSHDDLIGRVARHWSETVSNGREGMKHAHF